MIQAAVSRVSPATETKGKTIRRWQAKNTTSVICPVCGQTFVLCSAAQRYCSSACREKAREQGIYLLPMPVIIEDKMYLEGTDITSAQLYEAMHQHQTISSSQPSPGQILEFWDGILDRGYDELVNIPMSSGLSNSCCNAIQMAREYAGRVQVVVVQMTK